MLEAIKGLVGELARPWAIIVTSTSAAITPIIIVLRTAPDRLDLLAAAGLIGAAYTGVAAIYGAKAVEVLQGKRADAKVEVEKVKATAAPPPPGATTITAGPDVDVSVREATGEGELPASQRVRP